MKKFLTLFLVIFLSVSVSHSQNLENRINKYVSDFGKGYSQPVVEGLGLMMNNGWVSVKAMKDLFSADIGIAAVFVPVTSSDKSFNIASPYDNTIQSVSTAVGSSNETTISGYQSVPGANPTTYPKGFNLSLIPVFMPQFTIGNLVHTRLTIRALPKIKTGDLGYISLFGVGLQHYISEDFIKPLPLDFGIMGSYETLKLGDIITANSVTGSAVVSKRVWKINFYTLLGYDYSKMKFSYSTTYYDPTLNSMKTTSTSFESQGKNGFKLCLGGTAETRFARFNLGMNLMPKFCFDLGLSVGGGLKKIF